MAAATTDRSAVRREAERRGRRAESLAVWLLRLKGYRLLARRYKTSVGEIDLIARRGRTIAFVEVNSRPTMEEATEAATPAGRPASPAPPASGSPATREAQPGLSGSM
jgi:putative endonuclease